MNRGWDVKENFDRELNKKTSPQDSFYYGQKTPPKVIQQIDGPDLMSNDFPGLLLY